MASSLSIFGPVRQWLHVRDRLVLRSACQTTQSNFEIRASCSAEQIVKAKEEECRLREAKEREVLEEHDEDIWKPVLATDHWARNQDLRHRLLADRSPPRSPVSLLGYDIDSDGHWHSRHNSPEFEDGFWLSP